MSEQQLTDETIAAIAQAAAEATVAALQRCGLVRTPQRMLDIDEVAEILGVAASWVYEHKAEIGYVVLGDGPRGSLRFDEHRVRDFIAARESTPRGRRDRTNPITKSTRARRRAPAGAGLIPFDED